ncbi:putative protein phosphatase 2C 55 [Capsicum baccatum]|uniref:Protein phosphatase n=1 Tax=Capsicum baccatum TaxID=33114 RepID=A0A2G2X5N0_CAPBA|nr:putative protein phosphatase 2C 55 [Capsicum baccatum]
MTAQKIAALAQQRAMDPTDPTPFADAAKEAGFEYHGGKLDDITVVVSYLIESYRTFCSWIAKRTTDEMKVPVLHIGSFVRQLF